MTDEPRRFRVILDTCDIVRKSPEPEVWPEAKAPEHSIFDRRNLSVHKPLDANGRIMKPRTSKPASSKPVKHRTPAPTEPCEVCNGSGRIEKGTGTLIVCSISCERCGGTGEQMKFVEKPKPVKPPKVYAYRRYQQHMSHGDPCTLCGQMAAEHRPNREKVKKEREGK